MESAQIISAVVTATATAVLATAAIYELWSLNRKHPQAKTKPSKSANGNKRVRRP
jgi:hypothetical protein